MIPVSALIVATTTHVPSKGGAAAVEGLHRHSANRRTRVQISITTEDHPRDGRHPGGGAVSLEVVSLEVVSLEVATAEAVTAKVAIAKAATAKVQAARAGTRRVVRARSRTR